MADTAHWPFGTDADRDDPLTELRVPAVNSFNPGWHYVAAYLKPVTDGPDYLKGPPFGSNERPTDREAQMLASFLLEHRRYWFRNQGYARKMDRRPLDVDSGWNTTVFIKYGPDDWGYRRCSWMYGHTFVPPGPSYRERYPDESCGGPLSLEQVMDRAHTLGSDEPMDHWVKWKADHPDVFPA
ncbi:hypothetical protein [Streptomyces sp. NPDC088812]|uniref:hypothetical protein n=1 Tax=Streptomyces sp. NPDC088812 TaxID=3365905 RepID=UPI00380B30E6